jgi:hypothetical protein
MPRLVPPIERAMAATVKLLLLRAQLPVPARVEELLQFHVRDTVRHAA